MKKQVNHLDAWPFLSENANIKWHRFLWLPWAILEHIRYMKTISENAMANIYQQRSVGYLMVLIVYWWMNAF